MKRVDQVLILMVLSLLPFIGSFIYTYLSWTDDGFGFYNVKYTSPLWVNISIFISAGLLVYWLYLIGRVEVE